MKEVLVSVIIPAYNAGLYIEETVRSVLAQTHKNLELIIINDGSTDNQDVIINKLLSEDKRIQYITQKNAGVSAARNHGYKLSKGEYLGFLDADDIWSSGNIEKKLEKFELDEELGLVHSDAMIINSASQETGEIIRGKEGWLLEDLLGWEGTCIPAPSSILVKRKVIEKTGAFNTGLANAADQEFFFRVAKYFKVGRVPIPLWSYRIHSNNMHNNVAHMEKDALFTYKCAKDNNLFHSKKFERYCFAKMYKIVGASWWGDGNNKSRGMLFFLKSFFYNPFLVYVFFYLKN